MKTDNPKFKKFVEQTNKRNERLREPTAERLVEEAKKGKKIIYKLK